MANQTVAGTETKQSVVVRLQEFYHQVMTEMKKVTWPTLDELKSSTSVVLLLLGVSAVIIYVFDVVFQSTILGILGFVGKGS